MPAGTCDPASRGATFNEGEQAVDNGNVDLYYRYGWDGVSTRTTGCDGPLLLGRATNNSALTYYAHFQGRKGTWKRLQLDPGVTRTYTQAQLTAAGFDAKSDLEGLFINTSPTPPTVT